MTHYSNNTSLSKLNIVGTKAMIIYVLFSIAYTADITAQTDYTLTQITKKIHVIYGPTNLPDKKNRGFRNNPVIIQTSKGIVVFDPGGSAYAGERIVQQIKSLTSSPIVAVFNSHVHGDHWLGNEGIKRHYPNVIIYAHPLMIKRIAAVDGVFWLDMINRLTKNTANGKLVVKPDKAVNHGDVIQIGDIRFRIFDASPAHTDTDIMIEIIEENTLFTGDVVRNKRLGIMQEDSSFKGNIAAINMAIKKNFKHYIPGHGQAGGIEMLKDYRNYLHLILSSVKKFYLQEMQDYQMKPEILQIVAEYSKWPGFDLRVGSHINRAYLEVEEENF